MQKHGLFYTRSTLTATIISLSLAACRSRDKAPLWITSPKTWQRSDLTTSQRTPSSSTPSPRLLWVQSNHEARTFKLLQANDLNLKWSQNVLTHALHEVAPSDFLAWIWKTQIHYNIIKYNHIIYIQSLSRGGIGIAHLSHWTITKHILPYAPVQSDVCQRKSRHIWIMALVEAVTKQWCGKA